MQRTIAALAGCAAALTLLLSGAYAAEEDESSLPQDQPAASRVRQESLELPGLTACHQCEWRPHLHEQAAPEQCGTRPDGAAKIGQFECGFSPDCDRICNFLGCVR